MDRLPTHGYSIFKYNGKGILIEKKVTDFINPSLSYTRRHIFDREDIIMELDQNNNIVAAYLHGPGIDEPIAMLRDENRNGRIEDQEVFIYTKDRLGSVKDVTDITENLIQRYHYSAYGVTKIEKDDHNRPAKIVENPYAYTGREYLQELGIYYYRARYYCPQMQRFISEDPIGFAGNDFNLYRYVVNNPILLTDPNGENWLVKACLIGLAGYAASKQLEKQFGKSNNSSSNQSAPTSNNGSNSNTCPSEKPNEYQKDYCQRFPENANCKELQYCNLIGD